MATVSMKGPSQSTLAIASRIRDSVGCWSRASPIETMPVPMTAAPPASVTAPTSRRAEDAADRRPRSITSEVWRTVGVASSASPTGRSSAADADLGRHPCSFESLLVPTSPASRLGASRSWCSSSASSGCRRARPPGWRGAWTGSSRTSPPTRSMRGHTRTSPWTRSWSRAAKAGDGQRLPRARGRRCGARSDAGRVPVPPVAGSSAVKQAANRTEARDVFIAIAPVCSGRSRP